MALLQPGVQGAPGTLVQGAPGTLVQAVQGLVCGHLGVQLLLNKLFRKIHIITHYHFADALALPTVVERESEGGVEERT